MDFHVISYEVVRQNFVWIYLYCIVYIVHTPKSPPFWLGHPNNTGK